MAGLSNEDLERQVLMQQLTKKTNHVLHLLLSVCTFGLWIPVWILIAINNRVETNKILDIANTGKISVNTRIKTIILILIIAALFAPFFMAISNFAGTK